MDKHGSSLDAAVACAKYKRASDQKRDTQRRKIKQRSYMSRQKQA